MRITKEMYSHCTISYPRKLLIQIEDTTKLSCFLVSNEQLIIVAKSRKLFVPSADLWQAAALRSRRRCASMRRLNIVEKLMKRKNAVLL